MSIEHVENDLPGIRVNRARKVMKACLTALNKYRLTEKELVFFLSNFIYSVGASMANHKGDGPGINQLSEKYYKGNASLGEIVMLEGLNMGTWLEDIDKSHKQDKEE